MVRTRDPILTDHTMQHTYTMLMYAHTHANGVVPLVPCTGLFACAEMCHGQFVGGSCNAHACIQGYERGLRHPRKDNAASALKPGKAKALEWACECYEKPPERFFDHRPPSYPFVHACLCLRAMPPISAWPMCGSQANPNTRTNSPGHTC